MKYKYVIVGAGLAGITVAERIATQLHEKVLIIEKRGQSADVRSSHLPHKRQGSV